MTDILCIGAHPDDVEIGMGAAVATFVRQGMSVCIVDLTDGEPTPHGTPESRALESAAAARLLGATRITLSQRNRELFDTVEARTELAEVIRDHRPRALFSPYPMDAHPDHVAAAAIVDAARFYAKFTKTPMRGEPHYPARVYRYMAVHMRIVATPAFIIDVSDDLDTKMAALECYATQFVRNPGNTHVLPMMKREAERWGSMIGTGAGEPFFSSEPVGVSDFSALI